MENAQDSESKGHARTRSGVKGKWKWQNRKGARIVVFDHRAPANHDRLAMRQLIEIVGHLKAVYDTRQFKDANSLILFVFAATRPRSSTKGPLDDE